MCIAVFCRFCELTLQQGTQMTHYTSPPHPPSPAFLVPPQVLLTPLGRLRVGCVGLLDALSGDLQVQRDPAEMHALQRQDLVNPVRFDSWLARQQGKITKS